VFVWIHGGGDVDGESNDYDASKLATGGPLGTPTVVVTMNYRLGLFGFFAHPAIDAEGHLFGNYRPGPAGRASVGAAQCRRFWRRPHQVSCSDVDSMLTVQSRVRAVPACGEALHHIGFAN
jgi:hypothetical protein